MNSPILSNLEKVPYSRRYCKVSKIWSGINSLGGLPRLPSWAGATSCIIVLKVSLDTPYSRLNSQQDNLRACL